MNEVVQALIATADLMEQDEARCRRLYGAPVGIPVSMADNLIHTACHGPFEEWRAGWIRLALAEGIEAASAWYREKAELKSAVFDLLFPRGTQSSPLNAEEVRSIAKRIGD